MKIHFIGIGGIGVSALAQYYLKKGHKISGSDLVASEITEALKKRGVEIFIGSHKSSHLTADAELVIYSPAIQPNNPELKRARELKIRRQSYPQALGELTKKYFTIAISGTHGKSTVTTMIGLLLKRAGLDPTVIVGTKVKEFGNSNCHVGKSKYLVIEADEHFASFLKYYPKIIVLTAIEKDHLDFYKNLNNVLKTFKKFVSGLPKEGILIANKDDKNIYKTFSKAGKKVCWYSLKQKEAKKIKKILKVPGEHNVSNALSALNLARALKIPDKISLEALSRYRGSWRRFESKQLRINSKKITLVSDYAHHPTEVKATLRAAREKFGKRKIWCVFQPHQYQRTFYLLQDFVKVFKEAFLRLQGKPLIDELIITDIYDVAGREEKRIKKKINSEELIKKINSHRAIYLPKEKIIHYLKKNLCRGEVVIIMGAGDIYKLSEQF